MKNQFRKGFVQNSNKGKFFTQTIKLDASTKVVIKIPIQVEVPKGGKNVKTNNAS